MPLPDVWGINNPYTQSKIIHRTIGIKLLVTTFFGKKRWNYFN